jgi:hypothetical protein
MQRLFTLNQAHHALSDVEAQLVQLEQAIESGQQLRDQLQHHAPHDPTQRMAMLQELRFIESEAKQAHEALASTGVVIHNLDSGVVEFPSRIGGEIVHLVWKRGEPSITHYHRLMGDDAPRPLQPHQAEYTAPSAHTQA